MKDSVKYVCDEELGEAFCPFRHEFWNYYITREIVEFLIQYMNMQKCVIERLIYDRKERLIRGLNKLYSEESSVKTSESN